MVHIKHLQKKPTIALQILDKGLAFQKKVIIPNLAKSIENYNNLLMVQLRYKVEARLPIVQLMKETLVSL